MEAKEANETVNGRNTDSDGTKSESIKENISCTMNDTQPTATLLGDPPKEADCSSFEVTSICDSTAEKSTASRTVEENLLQSTSSDSQERLSETAQEKCKHNSGSADTEREHCDAIELPSTVTDREEIFMPHGIEINDPRIYGKWMLFTYGDLNHQDRLWIQLQELLHRGDAILLKSSTARKSPDHGQSQGVIMCYTSEDKDAIRRAGVSIQDILKEDVVLNYKTNEDSNKNLYRRLGSRFIAKYMLLAKGKLYERDYLDRWKKVTDNLADDPFVGRSSEECLPVNKKPKQGSQLFPSRERKIPRYYYPGSTTLRHGSGIWRFFCDVIEVDSYGMTELDRMWQQAVVLCEEGCFSSISCETYAFKAKNGGNCIRRSVTCELKDYTDVKRIIRMGDKLRERTSYCHPMYFDVCLRESKKKLQYHLKYMYTEDGELYEHDSKCWKLLQNKL